MPALVGRNPHHPPSGQQTVLGNARTISRAAARANAGLSGAVPAFGSYATPASVGIPIGNRGTLITVAAQPSGSVVLPNSASAPAATPATSTWTWGPTGLSNADPNVSIEGCDLQGPLQWSGTGFLFLKNCIVDACCTLAGGLTPPNLSTGYVNPYNLGDVPITYGLWTGAAQGVAVHGTGTGWIIAQDCTFRTTQAVGGQAHNFGVVCQVNGRVQLLRCDLSGTAQMCYPIGAAPGTFGGAYAKQCVFHDVHWDLINGTDNSSFQHNDGVFVAGGTTIEISQCWMEGVTDTTGATAPYNPVTAALFVQNTGVDANITSLKLYANYLGMNGGFPGGLGVKGQYALRNQSGILVDARNNEFANPLSKATREAQTTGFKLASYLGDPGDGTLGNGNLHSDLSLVELLVPTGSGTAVPAAPAAPTGLSAVAAPGGVTVVWAQVPESVSYAVQRSPDGTTGWTVIASTTVATSIVDTPSNPMSTNYWYRILATNPGGTSTSAAVGTNVVGGGTITRLSNGAVTPGSVGYRPDTMPALTIIDTPAAAGGTVTINGTVWTWIKNALSNNAIVLNSAATNPNLSGYRVNGIIRWFNGSGTFTLGTAGHGCIVDSRANDWTKTITDLVTVAGSSVVHSATANFHQPNVGDTIAGVGIPPGTTIVSVTPNRADEATLSAPVTNTNAALSVTLSLPNRLLTRAYVNAWPLGSVCAQGGGTMVPLDSSFTGDYAVGYGAQQINAANGSSLGSFIRCDMSMAAHFVEPGGNQEVTDCWLHDPQLEAGNEHPDGIAVINGNAPNLTIQHNYIDSGIHYGQAGYPFTAAVFSQGPGTMTGWVIDGNFFRYNRNLEIANQNCPAITITNNLFDNAVGVAYSGSAGGTLGTNTGNRTLAGGAVTGLG